MNKWKYFSDEEIDRMQKCINWGYEEVQASLPESFRIELKEELHRRNIEPEYYIEHDPSDF